MMVRFCKRACRSGHPDSLINSLRSGVRKREGLGDSRSYCPSRVHTLWFPTFCDGTNPYASAVRIVGEPVRVMYRIDAVGARRIDKSAGVLTRVVTARQGRCDHHNDKCCGKRRLGQHFAVILSLVSPACGGRIVRMASQRSHDVLRSRHDVASRCNKVGPPFCFDKDQTAQNQNHSDVISARRSAA